MWDDFDGFTAGIIVELTKSALEEEHLAVIATGAFIPLVFVVCAGDTFMENALEQAARQTLATLRAIKALRK